MQSNAGGVCRQPEGIAIDPEGNLYASSNADSAATVGHVCYVMSNLTNEIEMFWPDERLIYRYMGFGDNAFNLNPSLVFKGRLGFISNMSATDARSEFEVVRVGDALTGPARHGVARISAAR